MSMLEFTEISQLDLRMEIKRQFPFLAADGSRFATVKAAEGDAVIFELRFNSKTEQQFHLCIIDVPTPKKLTVVDKEDAESIKTVYEQTEIIERQILMLDPVYANAFAIEPIPPAITCLSLAPKNIHSNISMISIVTKTGVCEIRTIKNNLRCYDNVLVDISSTWKACCAVRHPGKFQNLGKLTAYYDDLVFTASCWCDDVKNTNRLVLFCGTRSGLILSVEIRDSKADILHINKSDLGTIAFLKFFSCGEKNKNEFIFAASTNGTLKVFLKNRNSELTESTVLWRDRDRMTFRCLEVYYDKNSDRIVIVTVKTSFVVVFLLSRDGKMLTTSTHYVGLITGLQYFENNQFIVCTLNGYTAMISLNWISDPMTIVIEQEDIKNDFDSKTYEILGMVTTKNRVGWLFLQSPIKLFEHSFHNRSTITVTSFNRMNPLSVMETKVESKIFEFIDCAEILRCTFFKFGPPEVPFELNFNGTQVDETFIRSLKIAATVLNVRISSFRKRVRSEEARQTEKDLFHIRKILEAYLAYKRLSHIAPVKGLSREQIISAAYFRKKMLDFAQDDTNPWMGDLRYDFVESIAALVSRTEGFNTPEFEKCAYCEGSVDFLTGFCKDEHRVPRCCITFIQIPIFEAKSCELCQYACIDDEKLLRQVMYPGEKIACPLCEGPFLVAKSRLFISGCQNE